jgi:hypothetical protein
VKQTLIYRGEEGMNLGALTKKQIDQLQKRARRNFQMPSLGLCLSMISFSFIA